MHPSGIVLYSKHMFEMNGAMRPLQGAVAELRAEDLLYLGDEEVEGDLIEMERQMGALEVEQARRVAEVERRGSYRRDGYLSFTCWVGQKLRMAANAAARLVRFARAIREMPVTRAALSDGEISRSSVDVLVKAREPYPQEFASAEDTLVEAARNLDVRDLRHAVTYWRQAIDHLGAEEEAERLHELRRLHVSATLEGMVRVDGDLDPETGQVLISALRSVEDTWARSGAEDGRTFAQRRADAVGEICRQSLDLSGRPEVAGERPHVVVRVDLGALGGGVGQAELEDAGPITPEQARRIACDAGVSRVITRGPSEPLDVGRKTPVVSAALRRAVVERDRDCAFPACDRPQAWCDAHHVRHWADGGETALSNLVLLCRGHHRMIHGGRFAVRMDEGRPRFSGPHWLALRAPPGRAA